MFETFEKLSKHIQIALYFFFLTWNIFECFKRVNIIGWSWLQVCESNGILIILWQTLWNLQISYCPKNRHNIILTTGYVTIASLKTHHAFSVCVWVYVWVCVHESRLGWTFSKQLTLVSDTRRFHRGHLYSAVVICLCCHFVVMSLFEVFLNQRSHKFFSFWSWGL